MLLKAEAWQNYPKRRLDYYTYSTHIQLLISGQKLA